MPPGFREAFLDLEHHYAHKAVTPPTDFIVQSGVFCSVMFSATARIVIQLYQILRKVWFLR